MDTLLSSTSTEILNFSRKGHFLFRKLFAQKEVLDIIGWTDALASLPDTPGGCMKYFEDHLTIPEQRILSRIENFEPYHPEFSQLMLKGRLIQIVGELLQAPAELFKDKINFKLPGGSGFKAHQDIQAGWDRYAKYYVTAMVAIDPCTLENGCLEIAQYSHKLEMIGENWVPLPEDSLPYAPLPMDPGDALFFDSYLPHRSGPNLTDKARRVLYVTYNAAREGNHRRQYFIDKRASYPPDLERIPGQEYKFRV